MNKPILKQRLRLLFCFLAVLLVFPAGCGPSQQDLEKAVGEYIKKNPKALQEAMRGQRPPPKPQIPLEERIKNAIPVPVGSSPAEGPADASITIVTFSDFQCPFCKRVLPTIKQLEKDYSGKIRYVFKQHPLPFHQNAMSAAKASLAANEQGKFWPMHDLLFENQQDLSEENIKKMAKQAGLNQAKFEKDWKSDKFDAAIQEDMKFAQSKGASGTPAFFINGVLLTGAQPLPAFKEVIDKLMGQPSKPSAPAAQPAQPAAPEKS